MDPQPAVLALALHPFRELPPPPGVERIEKDGILVDINPCPTAQIIEPLDLEATEVPLAIAAARALARERGKRRWDEYRTPGNPSRQYLARIGDETVGTADAGFGDAGINLFGGSVVAQARGRGVYRALTVARWEEAVRYGSPALTVQAGKMSMPVLANLGFAPVAQIRVYVDELDDDGG
jgi:hypothetical protein